MPSRCARADRLQPRGGRYRWAARIGDRAGGRDRGCGRRRSARHQQQVCAKGRPAWRCQGQMSVLLPTHPVEKIWGRTDLPASFDCPPGARIGEIWFEPPPAVPALLVKYIFTSEKLSVQVHPGAGQAPAGMSGKEECWYILDAEPDARIAIGFDSPLGAGELRSAAIDGSIEQLLTWHEVRPGDFFYIPAGTVHAIGAGISLIELQQNCDITYRLYDYGRPRELHLDAAIEVAQRDPHPDELRRPARREPADPACRRILRPGAGSSAGHMCTCAGRRRGRMHGWGQSIVGLRTRLKPYELDLMLAPGDCST